MDITSKKMSRLNLLSMIAICIGLAFALPSCMEDDNISSPLVNSSSENVQTSKEKGTNSFQAMYNYNYHFNGTYFQASGMTGSSWEIRIYNLGTTDIQNVSIDQQKVSLIPGQSFMKSGSGLANVVIWNTNGTKATALIMSTIPLSIGGWI